VPNFSAPEIDSAVLARKAFTYLRAGEFGRMVDAEVKSLLTFHLGNSGILVPPAISNRILSCLVDPGDLTGVVDSMTISAAAVHFLIDEFDGSELFGWACQSDCTFNQPGADISKNLGQLELRPEELRGLICATRISSTTPRWTSRAGSPEKHRPACAGSPAARLPRAWRCTKAPVPSDWGRFLSDRASQTVALRLSHESLPAGQSVHASLASTLRSIF
jgi:hypothetical protein